MIVMEKKEAIQLIDDHKNQLIDPVAMLHWTWLRVILNNLDDAAWEVAVVKATEIMSR